MPRWLKWTLGILAVLIIAIGAGYWWFIVDGSPPSNLDGEDDRHCPRSRDGR